MTLTTVACRLRPLLAMLALLAAGACRDQDKSGAAPAHAPGSPAPTAATTPTTPTPTTDMPSVQPAELASRLAAGEKPLLLHVGYKKLYEQAHIPGSEFFGPTTDAAVVEQLRARVADLPRTTEIIIYCGCCPWERCPNVKPAYAMVRDLGFTNAKVLYIPQDLGVDWVDKGYPAAKGG